MTRTRADRLGRLLVGIMIRIPVLFGSWICLRVRRVLTRVVMRVGLSRASLLLGRRSRHRLMKLGGNVLVDELPIELVI